ECCKTFIVTERFISMSERNFSRRRSRGMRFRPSGGLGHVQPRPDRDATQARAEVVGGQSVHEKVYDHRHTSEIDRAENIAAGLPPEGATEKATAPPVDQKKDLREPHLDTPAKVEEEKAFEPIRIQEQNRGIVESIKAAASTLVKKVQRLIKPVH